MKFKANIAIAWAEGGRTNTAYKDIVEGVDGVVIKSIMKHTNQNQTQAAAILGIHRSTLRRKMCRIGLLVGE